MCKTTAVTFEHKRTSYATTKQIQLERSLMPLMCRMQWALLVVVLSLDAVMQIAGMLPSLPQCLPGVLELPLLVCALLL